MECVVCIILKIPRNSIIKSSRTFSTSFFSSLIRSAYAVRKWMLYENTLFIKLFYNNGYLHVIIRTALSCRRSNLSLLIVNCSTSKVCRNTTILVKCFWTTKCHFISVCRNCDNEFCIIELPLALEDVPMKQPGHRLF